jgi:hypothetical protein
MKKLFLLLPVIILSFSAADSALTKEEREVAIKYMKETKEGFLNDVKGLSETQLNFKTSPDRWSVAQCIEHIAIAENALMGLIQNNQKQPADPSKRPEVKATDTDVWTKVTDRSRKGTAPEFLKPSGKFKNSEEAVKAFVEQRDKNIEYVQTTNDDLRDHFMPHPAIGPIDDYQWLILIAAHSRRHTLQIEEVKADPGFPKN